MFIDQNVLIGRLLEDWATTPSQASTRYGNVIGKASVYVRGEKIMAKNCYFLHFFIANYQGNDG